MFSRQMVQPSPLKRRQELIVLVLWSIVIAPGGTLQSIINKIEGAAEAALDFRALPGFVLHEYV
jgi:hypothetical protein